MTQIVLDRESGGAASAPAQASRIAVSRSTRPGTRPLRSRRPSFGSGRGAAPVLRPAAACPAPGLARGATAGARACALPVPEPDSAGSRAAAVTWRLTDRGVATVLVAGLMIMVAALTVVGLTAFKVTGEGYRPTVSASLPR